MTGQLHTTLLIPPIALLRDPYDFQLLTTKNAYHHRSGSYDEKVRVWDSRSLRDPLSTTPTGGGVWRLKWHPNPSKGNLLLAACMHAGVRVLSMGVGPSDPLVSGELEPSPAELEKGSIDEGGRVVATYTRHESMAYGVDWCRLSSSLQCPQAVIASCSFYDSLLCLWSSPPLWT